ncbi:MAG: hypothetical protein HZB67_04250 [Candidatus Aenigmarchaeota archaeon]|nr:hypothetical protein [Candidatus Aenigmarchaeota archaeon]
MHFSIEMPDGERFMYMPERQQIRYFNRKPERSELDTIDNILKIVYESNADGSSRKELDRRLKKIGFSLEGYCRKDDCAYIQSYSDGERVADYMRLHDFTENDMEIEKLGPITANEQIAFHFYLKEHGISAAPRELRYEK